MVWVPMQMQMQMQAQTQIRIREIEFTSDHSRRAMKEREVVGPKPDDLSNLPLFHLRRLRDS